MQEQKHKRWVLKEADEGLVTRHAADLKVPPLLARILVLRGLTDLEDAKRFLSASLRSDLPSPFLMADMDAAADRVLRAVRGKEPICIWGDYDVDGTTGAAVLVSFLREIGAEPIYYVPHRIDEGYGLNSEGLSRLHERGVGLVVSVDCGISNGPEIEAARSLGLDVVVVDHHQPPEILPPAVAILNPHRPDCSFPDKGMCGAGLAFYLLIGLRAKLRDAGWFTYSEIPDLRRYLDIVTLGTIADMVPLRGVNRILTRRGLEELGGSTRAGVLALKQVSAIAPGAVGAGQVGFRLGPRINAAGRMDDGMKVVELLTTDSRTEADRIARELDEHNRERRAMEAQVLEQALAQVAEDPARAERFSLVLGGEGWHPGVLGIVASRILERFHRPTIVVGFHGGEGKGSARSIRGLHMVEGFRRCADALEKFGGHEYAGGLTIKRENFSRFAESFENFARQTLTPDDLVPRLEIDAALSFADIGFPLMRELEALKPYGVGNPEPLFVSRDIEVLDRKNFSAGARFRLRQKGRILGAVAFGVGDDFPAHPGTAIDAVYRLSENEWNGNTAVELKIVDARSSNAASA